MLLLVGCRCLLVIQGTGFIRIGVVHHDGALVERGFQYFVGFFPAGIVITDTVTLTIHRPVRHLLAPEFVDSLHLDTQFLFSELLYHGLRHPHCTQAGWYSRYRQIVRYHVLQGSDITFIGRVGFRHFLSVSQFHFDIAGQVVITQLVLAGGRVHEYLITQFRYHVSNRPAVLFSHLVNVQIAQLIQGYTYGVSG